MEKLHVLPACYSLLYIKKNIKISSFSHKVEVQFRGSTY